MLNHESREVVVVVVSSKKKENLNLVSKSNTTSKQDSTDDEHGDVLCSAIEGRPDQKAQASSQHGRLSPEFPGHSGGHE